MAHKDDDTFGEEAAAFGQRAKGAAKDAIGAATGNTSLEREGERENAAGRARQASNNVTDETDGARGATVRPRTGAPSGYVTGLYGTPEDAGRAYETLVSKHGYQADDISVLMSDETRKRHFGDVKPGEEFTGHSSAAEGFGKGSAIGGGIGAALAALLATGTSIAIPGLGLVVAGPLAAALAGAGAGGATGGLIGALVGAGLPDDRVAEYDRGLRDGGIVLGTRARDDRHAAELARDFEGSNGRGVLR
jgi:uncharacterized protein YjbJ (UPF0337 family)